MAKGSKKHFGAGSKDKGGGSGGMAGEANIRENAVLSNRDKKQHADGRGQDGKWAQTENLHDHELNQRK